MVILNGGQMSMADIGMCGVKPIEERQVIFLAMISLVWMELSPLGLETDCLENIMKEKVQGSVDQGIQWEGKGQ